jgi:hypothetical protein
VAVTAIPLTTGSDTTNTATYTTASITPTAGRLVLVAVLATVGSGTAPAITISGCGLNWVEVDQTNAGSRIVHLFRAMGAPSDGPLTITAASALTSALWQVTEFNGVDTSGADGSGAIVQSVNGRPGSSTTASVAFPGTVAATNSTFGAVAVSVQETPAPGGSGWVSAGATSQTAPTSGLLAEYATPAAQNISASWTTATNSFVVGAEIKAASGVTVPTGAADGAWSFTGAATGTAPYGGAASGAWSFTGTAVGGNAPVGAASGAWSFTGAAAGVSDRGGDAAGTWGFAGTAAGTSARTGSASGAWTFTGTAFGAAPVPPAASHTYGYATLVPQPVGTATLTGSPGAATLTSNGVGTATLPTYTPGLATLQTDL